MLWQHDDDLLPDNTTLQIIDVVYFVEYDKLYISDKIRSPIQHTPEDLGGHDETASFGSDLHISSKNADIVECLAEIAELLVTQSFDRRCVNSFGHVLGSECDRVLCDHCLASGRMCGYEH